MQNIMLVAAHIKMYDSELILAPLCYISSIIIAYLSLVTSSRQPQYFVFTAIVLIIALIGINRIIDSLYRCPEYYVCGV